MALLCSDTRSLFGYLPALGQSGKRLAEMLAPL
jgi:hypothetical protein